MFNYLQREKKVPKGQSEEMEKNRKDRQMPPLWVSVFLLVLGIFCFIFAF